MNTFWMTDWPNAREHFCQWWNHQGLVLRIDGLQARVPHEAGVFAQMAAEQDQADLNAQLAAWQNRRSLAGTLFLADTLPIAMPDRGTVTLCTYLGSEPESGPDTVWYSPCITDPDRHPALRFDPRNPWWQRTWQAVAAAGRLAGGNYLVGCPALTPGLDCLAMLRGVEELMVDLMARPDWVKQKLQEINAAYFAAADLLYPMISLEDGSSAFGYFSLWGPGKTAQVQCDVSAMISPAMFAEFVVPGLREQCRWLDHSMFHLDGTQCLCHLDQLLDLQELQAVEWTPQAGIENGGAARWHPLYRRILAAGKSVQVVLVEPEEVLPLLDGIGNQGVYIMTSASDEKTADDLVNEVDKKWR
jgi:hypothetical protein